MWSAARALILHRSILRNVSLSPTLIQCQSQRLNCLKPIFITSKFFSSTAESTPEDDESFKKTQNLIKNPAISSHDAFAPSLIAFEGDDLNSSWEETTRIDASLGSDDIAEGSVAEFAVVNPDELESVLSILQSTLPHEIGSSLGRLEELHLSEEFVVRVFQDAHVSGENLVSFFGWAVRREESVKTLRALDKLVCTVSSFDEISKAEADVLWDLIKELCTTKGIVNTDILNQIISIFRKLEVAEAVLEVFNKFDEFGCLPDICTYSLTIEYLGKKLMFDEAWSVCEKMIHSECLPDAEKTGMIITFFCRGKKAKEAHLVYLLAKKKNIFPGCKVLTFLIRGLCSKNESVPLALELLEDYPKNALKNANYTFTLVLEGLAKIKDLKSAKSLLLRMVGSGPLPGNSAFNHVITGLCKEGEVDEAINLTKVMERRGLRPDVYTYSVIMSGFAKAGLMDEAFKIFCEAKKKHKLLARVTYHTLIRGYCRIEEYEKALECLKVMKEDGVQPNADEYDKLIKSLCLKAIDWRSAKKLAEEMKETGLYLNEMTRSLIAAVQMLEEEVESHDSQREA